jgi:hypothetical protein
VSLGAFNANGAPPKTQKHNFDTPRYHAANTNVLMKQALRRSRAKF